LINIWFTIHEIINREKQCIWRLHKISWEFIEICQSSRLKSPLFLPWKTDFVLQRLCNREKKMHDMIICYLLLFWWYSSQYRPWISYIDFQTRNLGGSSIVGIRRGASGWRLGGGCSHLLLKDTFCNVSCPTFQKLCENSIVIVLLINSLKYIYLCRWISCQDPLFECLSPSEWFSIIQKCFNLLETLIFMSKSLKNRTICYTLLIAGKKFHSKGLILTNPNRCSFWLHFLDISRNIWLLFGGICAAVSLNVHPLL
jgi:hypothetical protein